MVIGEPPGKLGMGNGEPTLVSIPVNAIGSTAIFVGVIPMAVTDDQLEAMLGIKAKIARFHPKAKVGYAKIQIPNGDVDRVLELDLSGVRPQTLCSEMAEF